MVPLTLIYHVSNAVFIAHAYAHTNAIVCTYSGVVVHVCIHTYHPLASRYVFLLIMCLSLCRYTIHIPIREDLVAFVACTYVLFALPIESGTWQEHRLLERHGGSSGQGLQRLYGVIYTVYVDLG